MDRRQFLEMTAAAAATWAAGSSTAHARTDQAAVPLEAAVPTPASLRSVTMPHRFGDAFNPPALTNQWGCVQASLDVTGLRSMAFPPFAQGEQSTAALSAVGESVTGVLFLDGEYFASRRLPVEFTWQPDRIERRAMYGSLELSSTTVVPFGAMAAAVRVVIRNLDRGRRKVEVKLALRGSVTRAVKPWDQAYSPAEFDNEIHVDRARHAVTFTARGSDAKAVQAIWPAPSRLDSAWVVYDLDLGPAESHEFVFAYAMGSRDADLQTQVEGLTRRFEEAAAATTAEWTTELRAAFTPGNDRFSGHLPVLVTSDASIRRLYHTAVMSALFFKRTTPHSVYGRTYVTLAPRYWETTTFLWDISLSAMLLAQLDPATLKRMLETWMQLDTHKHFGTEFLTGAGVGPWYSVNDFAMCRMAREYVRWTGDHAWLDTVVAGTRVIDRLVAYATHWRTLDVNGHGLADYGGVSNLLEAVSSYVHEVAGMNAANVYNLRFVAELLDLQGEPGRASALRAEAATLAGRVRELYVEGEGVWNCRLPDGGLQTVRHCYDFGTVLSTIGADLDDRTRSEMVHFFTTELQTPNWMRALSKRDFDVTFSIRPDHQWTGAYAAWPSLALTALFNAGESGRAVSWMRGLGETARQGPIAQAHFAEDVVAPEAGGGALKVPSDQPYINDWACVSGCAYLEPIVESLFGVRAGIDGTIEAAPQFSGFDPAAELRGLAYQGRLYTVTGKGLARA